MTKQPPPTSDGRRRPALRRLRRWLGLLAARAFFRAVPHVRRIGLRPVAVRRRGLVARLPFRQELIGDPWRGQLHGGAVTTLVDQTSGTAASFAVFPPNVVATLDLRLDHLRPAVPGRDVFAEAEAFRVTRHVIFVRCTAHDGDPADPIAYGTASFMRNGLLPGGLFGRR